MYKIYKRDGRVIINSFSIVDQWKTILASWIELLLSTITRIYDTSN